MHILVSLCPSVSRVYALDRIKDCGMVKKAGQIRWWHETCGTARMNSPAIFSHVAKAIDFMLAKSCNIS